jgi:hypothetical protein
LYAVEKPQTVEVALKRSEINLRRGIDFETPATPLAIARLTTLLCISNVVKRI